MAVYNFIKQTNQNQIGKRQQVRETAIPNVMIMLCLHFTYPETYLYHFCMRFWRQTWLMYPLFAQRCRPSLCYSV